MESAGLHGGIGYTVKSVGLHGGSVGLYSVILGYMVGSIELHGGMLGYMTFELKPVMPETCPIRLESKVLEWTTSITHVGNYIRNDLSESGEIRHKQVILLENLMFFSKI